MNFSTGEALAAFVNQYGTRFSSEVLPTRSFNSECWVLVADAEQTGADGHRFVFEPIADFDNYMSRLRLYRARFPEEYITLLGQWEAECNAA